MKTKKDSRVKFKPPVAFESESAAHANIELKIDFLKGVIERVPANISAINVADDKFLEILKTLPRSKNRFNGLSTDDLVEELKAGSPVFRRNAPITLRRNKVLTGRVEEVLGAISLAVDKLSQPPKKAVQVGRLVRQLKLSNTLREIAEETIYAQKRQIEKLRNEVAAYKNKLESLRRASEDCASGFRREIKRLKGEVINEVSESQKVVSLPVGPVRT